MFLDLLSTYIDLAILIPLFIFFVVTLKNNNPMNHDQAFRSRRFFNWLFLGLTYAFLYMGRYNLTVAKMAFGDVMTKADFGMIFGAGTLTYAFSFLINGPLTDKFGGRLSILLAAGGSSVMNAAMGILTYLIVTDRIDVNIPVIFSILYALNMYFQSMGALSIVKVNSFWFHVKERGVLGALFGILISLGIYFAFDWGGAIVKATRIAAENLTSFQEIIRSVLVGSATQVNQTWWVFFVPAMILAVFFIVDFFIIRNMPSEAGHADFDTADASSGEMDIKFSSMQLYKKILTNPIILTICAIEFCSGMKETNKMLVTTGQEAITFFQNHWGLFLMLAGILGGVFAGFISDKVFGSRRGPVAAFLYAGMLIMSIFMAFMLKNYYVLGALAIFGSLCVIGVHGMLSGTATADFGGRKGAATAVGVVDGAVYLGTGFQSICLGFITTKSWTGWPIFLIPFAVIGLLLAVKIWHAFPDAKRKGAK